VALGHISPVWPPPWVRLLPHHLSLDVQYSTTSCLARSLMNPSPPSKTACGNDSLMGAQPESSTGFSRGSNRVCEVGHTFRYFPTPSCGYFPAGGEPCFLLATGSAMLLLSLGMFKCLESPCTLACQGSTPSHYAVR
jgi:hypothetical protein